MHRGTLLMNEKWDLRFLKLAKEIANWSKDNSTKIGCVISKGKKLRSVGFNGIPTGIDDTIVERNNRPTKYFWFSHAEVNALFNYPKSKAKNCTMYVTHFPCATCARSIIENKIERVVVISRETTSFDERWKEEHNAALAMLQEAGIIISEYKEELI